ncbi:M56 family metallopeptidase [Ferrimicrobium sp.]|uniref:M56 family metallopeptidase n=1 Tax=Ferrimicrobium sp. TaxID=2926050 RepID=UPI0026227DB9|nr:M56 family metallopeptidase [Ferrimicrobium sp.]
MTLLFLGLVAILMLAVLPYGLERLSRHINAPQAISGGYLLALIGWVIVPTAWIMCTVGSLVDLLFGHQLSVFGCDLGLGAAPWNLSGYLFGILLLVPLGFHFFRGAHATRNAQRDLCTPMTTASYRSALGGTVRIVASNEVAAASIGFLQAVAVVTTGTLALLTDDERHAVLEHEAAHLRLGHTRLLLLAASVVGGYAFLPPVRAAWRGLTRELEVAADNEARKVVRPQIILSAVAKVATRRASGPAVASFNGSDDLRYRIRRLQGPMPSSPQQLAGVILALVAPAVLVVVSSCLMTTHSLISPSLGLCGLTISLLIFLVSNHLLYFRLPTLDFVKRS